jgi:hypothetical protein
MWEPSSDYSSFYGKRVIVEYNYSKGRTNKIFKTTYGILYNISLPNVDGDYTVVLINPITKCTNCIVSTLITKIIYDRSIENLGNFKNIKRMLCDKLNCDIVSEIPQYLINDIVLI